MTVCVTGATGFLGAHIVRLLCDRGDEVAVTCRDPGRLGLLADLGARRARADIRDYRAFIDNIHLKDYADGVFQVLGEGEIDFDPIFQALREIGYDGWLCADEESGCDLQAGMQACGQVIRARR